MPKKRHAHSNPKPFASPHPSLGSSRPDPTPAKAERSVSTLLEHLRQSQSPNSAPNTLRTSIPHPQYVSHTVADATPNVGLSPREQMAQRRQARRLPGPAAPISWANAHRGDTGDHRGLQGSQHAPRTSISKSKGRDHSSLVDAPWPPLLPSQFMPVQGSLMDLSLRTLARNWQWYLNEVTEDPPVGSWLALLPPRIKSALLVYLSREGAITRRKDLELLAVDRFVDKDGEESPFCGEEITHLIIGWSISESKDEGGISWKELGEMLGPVNPAFIKAVYQKDQESERDKLDLEPSRSPAHLIPDSWDDPNSKIAPSSLFPHLTHLSLASCLNPSWDSLVNQVLPHLTSITHLDLSFWPIPSSTSFTTTSDHIKTPLEVFDGSIMDRRMERLENDPQPALSRDAPRFLRRLGKECPCLQYLALKGCTWLSVLTRHMVQTGFSPDRWAPERNPEWSMRLKLVIGIEKNFRLLRTLCISQDHIPKDLLLSEEEFQGLWKRSRSGPVALSDQDGASDRDLWLRTKQATSWIKQERIIHQTLKILRIEKLDLKIITTLDDPELVSHDELREVEDNRPLESPLVESWVKRWLQSGGEPPFGSTSVIDPRLWDTRWVYGASG